MLWYRCWFCSGVMDFWNKTIKSTVTGCNHPKTESTSTDEIASNLRKRYLFTDRGVLQEWISTCSLYLYSVRLYSCKRYLKVNEMLHGRMHLLCSGLKYVRISTTKRTGNMCCWIQNWQTLHLAVHFPIQTQHNEDVSSFIKFSV